MEFVLTSVYHTPSLASGKAFAMNTSQAYLKYVHLGDRPSPERHVIVTYYARRAPDSQLEGLAFLGGVAAESSTGTWIEVQTDGGQAAPVSGRVFAYDEATGLAKIAYPLDLFEPGNVSQLLTVVAGNAFGLADVRALKLLDLQLPRALVDAFDGPAVGLDGIYATLGQSRGVPIVGAIMKPKCGLSAGEHAALCFQAWTGMAAYGGEQGVDMVKDDEALSHQVGFQSGFYERVQRTMQALKRAEDLTGTKKIYIPNVTHSSVTESLRRAAFVQDMGGDAVMIDYVMGGCVLLHSLRQANLGLILHGHRTLFAAMHRPGDFGVDYMVWAKLFRLIGGDQVHIGTPGVGVMQASTAKVAAVYRAMTAAAYRASATHPEALAQDFCGKKAVLPICGAGLDPLTTQRIAEALGAECAIFAGGGVHGHPHGTAAGAAALRESVVAFGAKQTMADWARRRQQPYLTEAVEFFGTFDKQSPNDSAKENQ
jgi:ribulose-bisphosphate carboxylase large chain